MVDTPRKKLNLPESTLRVMAQMLNTPPQPHKDGKPKQREKRTDAERGKSPKRP